MNKLFLIVPFLVFLLIPVSAQNTGAPYGFNYQAIARDFNGIEMKNKPLTVRARIISGSETGEIEWSENHNITTNEFGLFTLIIGQGSRNEESKKSSFSDLQWGSAPHYIEISLDFNDTQGFRTMGRSRLFSVPYALYADYAKNGGGGTTYDNDTDPTNERQNLSQKNDTLLQLINNDGTVQSSVKIDFDPKNEMQDLKITNHVLTITNNSDANEINLATYLDNTDNQSLTMEGDSIKISNGTGVNISSLRNPQSYYFYSEKTTTSTVTSLQNVFLKFNENKINIGNAYSVTTGTFTAPETGLYSFYIIYYAYSGQKIMVFVNNGEYDALFSSEREDNNKKFRSSFMLYLEKDNSVNIVVDSGLSEEIGKATWSGFKVY